MHGRRVGLEVTELPLPLGEQPPLTTSHLWRLVEAAVLVGHTSISSQTGWHTEAFEVKRLLPHQKKGANTVLLTLEVTNNRNN